MDTLNSGTKGTIILHYDYSAHSQLYIHIVKAICLKTFDKTQPAKEKMFLYNFNFFCQSVLKHIRNEQ